MAAILECMTAIGRTGVGVIVLAAGVVKIRAGASFFKHAILGYDLVPRKFARPLALWLPRVEILLGLLLIAGAAVRLTDAFVFLLISVLQVAVLSSLARGRKHHCGCMGFTVKHLQEVQWKLAYRNLMLLAILVVDAAWTVPLGIIDHAVPNLAIWLRAPDPGAFLIAFALICAAAFAARIYAGMRASAPALAMARVDS